MLNYKHALFFAFISLLLMTSCGSPSPEDIAHKVIDKARKTKAISWTEYSKSTAPFIPDTTIHRKSKNLYVIDTTDEYARGQFLSTFFGASGDSISKSAPSKSRSTYDGTLMSDIDFQEEEIEITDFEKYPEHKEERVSGAFITDIANILEFKLKHDSIPLRIRGEEIIDGKACYVLECNFREWYIFPFAKELWVENRKGENHIMDYTIWIDKEDYLPRRMIHDAYQQEEKDVSRAYFDYAYYDIALMDKDTIQLDAMAHLPEDFNIYEDIPRAYQSWLGIPINSPAPKWNLPSLSGDSVSLPTQSDQLTLIEFTSVFCGACHRFTPKLKNIHQKYNAKGLKVVAIETYLQDQHKLNRIMKDEALPYPYLYQAKEVAKAYKVKGVPAFYLVDKNGEVVYRTSGSRDDTEKLLTEQIEKYL